MCFSECTCVCEFALFSMWSLKAHPPSLSPPFLHNCFLGAAWLSRAPGPPGEVLPADRQLGPAGDMPGPAEPLKSAGWL